MRVLVFHGYLLGGTGSNVYNARLAAALARAGHEVHLLARSATRGSTHSSTPAARGPVGGCGSTCGASPRG